MQKRIITDENGQIIASNEIYNHASDKHEVQARKGKDCEKNVAENVNEASSLIVSRAIKGLTVETQAMLLQFDLIKRFVRRERALTQRFNIVPKFFEHRI